VSTLTALALSLHACAAVPAWPSQQLGTSVISKSHEGLHPAETMDLYVNKGWCLVEKLIDEESYQVLHLAGTVDSPCGPLGEDVYCFTGMEHFDPEKDGPAGVECKRAIVFDQCNKF
jgi:hypothetical protein